MRNILTLFFLITLSFSLSLAGPRIYVKTDGKAFSNAIDHDCWMEATNDLQKAINELSNSGGGEIWIAHGTYYPIQFMMKSKGDSIQSFVLNDSIMLFGGFQGNESDTSQRNRIDADTNGIVEGWEFQYPTVFSGDLGIKGDRTDNSRHVIYCNDSITTAMVDGCVITTGGRPLYYISDYGAGVHHGNYVNCRITNNVSEYAPGVYKASLLNCLVDHNKERFNMGYHGFGAVNGSVLNNCRIEHNSTSFGGGLVECNATQCDISYNHCIWKAAGAWKGTYKKCRFIGNRGGDTDLAGGVADVNCDSCVFIENIGNMGTGAAYNSTITNSYFLRNKGSNGGAAQRCNLTNCILDSNLSIMDGGAANNSVLINCKINGNESYYHGGGTYKSKVINCELMNNKSMIGGACAFDIVINSLIMGNKAASSTAVFSSYSVNSTIVNNVIDTIYGVMSGAAISTLRGGNKSVIKNCIVWGNKPLNFFGTHDVSYSGIEAGYSGEGNINLDSTNDGTLGPRFKNPTDSIELADWRTTVNSPCINAGNNSFIDTIKYDLNGNKRIKFDTIDMGAYECMYRFNLPNIGIDYLVEKTNCNIPNYVAWSRINDFSRDFNWGENVPVDLEPCCSQYYLYFKTFETDSTAKGIDSILVPARPAPPSNDLVDDLNDIFSWDYSTSGWNKWSDYEYKILDSGWKTADTNFIYIGNINLPIGEVEVRVNASNQKGVERFDGYSLVNYDEFTKTLNLSDNRINKLYLYPTITQDYITIFNENLLIGSLNLYDINGVKLSQIRINKSNTIVSMLDYPVGVYVIQFNNKEGIKYTSRIIRK